MRAAASSTASGRLSRRAQSSAISSLGSSLERSQKRETASGLGERRHRVLDLALHAQELAARDEEGEVGAGLKERGELGRRLDHLLQVVEEEQHLALADVLGEAVLGAERLGDRLRDERGVAQGGEPDPEDACLVLGDECGSRLEREPGLARAPGPGQRDESSSLLDQGEDRLRARASLPTKELAGRGRFVFEIVLSGGKLSSPSWKMATACSMSFRRCSPRSVST